MTDRRSLYACLAAGAAGVSLSIIIHSSLSSPNIYSDIGSFWGRTWIQQGQIPYVQAFFEYPPISGFIIYFARMVGGNYDGYYAVVAVLTVLTALALAWSTWRVASMRGTRLNPLYFVLPSMVVYGFYSFDLFNALFIILSLQFLLEQRKDLSAVMLGLAVATKLVGVVLLPVYVAEMRSSREGLRYFFMAAATVAVFYVPIAIVNFNSLTQFVDYFRAWGLEDAWYVWIFQDPSTWGYAKSFGLILTGVLLLRIYTLKLSAVPKSFLALSAYLLGTYIYAPQFNVMLIPLVGVLAIEDASLYVWDAFNALIILTWFVGFGTPDWHPTLAWTIPQTVSLVRSAALAVMAFLVAKNYLGRARWGSEGETSLIQPRVGPESQPAFASASDST